MAAVVVTGIYDKNVFLEEKSKEKQLISQHCDSPKAPV